MTQARHAVMAGLLGLVDSEVPCPTWCRHSGGHPFTPEDAEDEPATAPLWREHAAAFEVAGCEVEIVQEEHAETPAGPIARDPVVCQLFAEGGTVLTPQLLRQLARMLGVAADALETITAAEGTPAVPVQQGEQ